MFPKQVIARFCRAWWHEDLSLLPPHRVFARYMRRLDQICKKQLILSFLLLSFWWLLQLFWWIVWIIKWLIGYTLQPKDKNVNPNEGIIEAITLQTIIIAELVALLAFLKENQSPTIDLATRCYLLFGYVVISLLPISGMIAMLRAKLPNEKHAYDQNVVSFTRLALGTSIILVIVFTGFAAAGVIPWQRQIKELNLKVARVDDDLWGENHPDRNVKGGDPRVIAYLPFCPVMSEIQPMPDPMVIDITLENRIASSWQIVRAEGQEIVLPINTKDHYPIEIQRDPDGKNLEVEWQHLKSSEIYVLVIKLHQTEKGISPQQLKAMIMEDSNKVLHVKVYYP